jgi:pimeloyl-ACP methyl ester carboxylesterase
MSRPSASTSLNADPSAFTADSTKITRYRTIGVDGLSLFYREAGAPDAPALLLLHGFPTSSHMYRELIPVLADRYRVVAPDLPGFGFTEAPDRKRFKYSFEHLANVIERFTEAVGLSRYALYVFDYGAPVGFRLAIRHPERITAVISQNGNAYLQGLSEGWNPIQAYWKEPSPENRAALRAFLKPETTEWQYRHGVPTPERLSPDAWTLDGALLARPGNDEIQLDLFGDYQSMSLSIPSSRNTSGRSGRRSWPCGAKTIRSSCPPVPRRSGGIIRMPRSICWRRVISLSKVKGPRLRSSSATSSRANCRNGAQ